jgi:hypothetical protein
MGLGDIKVFGCPLDSVLKICYQNTVGPRGYPNDLKSF